MTEQELSPGRIVHYVVDRGRSLGDCRPAIVVNTFAKPGQKSTYGQGDMANMVVFADGSNDGNTPHNKTGGPAPEPPVSQKENPYRSTLR